MVSGYLFYEKVYKEKKSPKVLSTEKQHISSKNIMFEVDDYSKAKIILNNYCINEELEVYEDDDTVSKLNKKLLDNNINVYRIYENKNSLENEFFKMVNND